MVLSGEVSELMRFVAKQSGNATTPMNMSELCRQFQTETGSPVAVHTLRARIYRLRDRIHEMNEFDVETRARMMLAVGAKVDPDFLIELKKHANVKVDDEQRIVRYEGKRELNDRSAPPTSSSAKRGTSGGKKRIRVDSDVSGDAEMLMPVGDGTSDLGGQNIEQEHNEKTARRSEIEQKPVVLFHKMQHSSADPENLVKNVPEGRAPEESSTSVRDLLILLRGALLPLESNHLNGLRRKIEAKIQTLSIGEDRKIPLETIHLQFDPCLFLLMKQASMNPEEESTSLRNFLCRLNSATCHLVHPSMTPFHEKMKSCLEELNAQDQRIPIKIVHNAMDAILNFIDP